MTLKILILILQIPANSSTYLFSARIRPPNLFNITEAKLKQNYDSYKPKPSFLEISREYFLATGNILLFMRSSVIL